MKEFAAFGRLNGIHFARVISVALWLFCQITLAANPPTTISPGYGNSLGMAVSSLTPTFSWNSTSGATGYGLYIRDMTAAGTPLIYPNSIGTTAHPLTGTSLTLPSGYLVNGHIYRWNMTSFVSATEGSAVSVALYFQTPAAAASVAATPSPTIIATPPQAVIASPPTINAPGGASSPGTSVNSLTPTFGWNWASGATGYGLYIRDMTAAGTPFIYPNASGTTYSPLTGSSLTLPNGYLVNGHIYRWNMTSFTGSKESSAVSGAFYFQTPSAASAPAINTPSSGSFVATVQPPQQVMPTSPITPTMPPLAEGQPDFSSSYYTTANPFWRNGNAPNASADAKAHATGGAFDPLALGNCTWYAYGHMLELGANPAQLARAVAGDAGDWANEAQSVFTVDKIPAVHSIAQLDSKHGFSHGHVAVVESKNADGTITVSESMYSINPDYNIQWRLHTYSSSWFDHYIHVFNASPSSDPNTTSSLPNNGGTVSGVAKPAATSSPQISTSVQNQTKSVVAPTTPRVTYVPLTLSVLPINGGILSGNGVCALGSSQTVNVTPSSDFIFESWTENGKVVSLSPSYNFTVNGSRNLVANFRQNFINHSSTPTSNPSPNSQNRNPWSIQTSTPNHQHHTNQFFH